MVDGWPVEIFVHNIKSQNYYFDEDKKNGQCSTMNMVITGHVIGPDEKLAHERKAIAEKGIAAGPESLTKDPDYRMGICAELFAKVGDFHLRTQNIWSGFGKQLVKMLKKYDTTFADTYIKATTRAQQGDIALLEKVITDVLQPHGGFLFADYKSVSQAWK
jgi:hypothetical protein